MNTTELLSALEWRYATKKFDATQKIPAEEWKALEQSLVMAPSSYGLQPWKFIVVQNPEIREKLKAASWNQTQVTDASHLVVLATKEKITEEDVKEFIKLNADVRGIPVEKLQGYQDIIMGDIVKGPRSAIAASWAQRQAYIAMGFVMESAAMLKVDTCPLEGLDPTAYDQILDLQGSGYKTVAAVALGYRHADDAYAMAKKVRYPTEKVVQYI
jgi:nitroreductase